MKLYGYFRSSTSYRLRLALQLKGLEYENCPVNLVEGQQKGEAFAGRNPFATVPMLEVDGKDRVQSMAIIEWLDEAYPETPLLPADIEQRYLARELAYAKSEYGQDQEGVETWYRHWLARTLQPIERRLAQLNTGDFLFDKPGFFEVVLMPQIYNARRFGYDFSDAPHTTRIEAACLALDEVQRAHPDNQNDTPEGETVQ